MRDADGNLISVSKPPTPSFKYQCPCCGFNTLHARGGDDICQVCFWEDNGQDEHDADDVRGGPNGILSLTAARNNFKAIGACEPKFLGNARRPLPEELVSKVVSGTERSESASLLDKSGPATLP